MSWNNAINVIARVLPPFFRVGAESEEIAIDRRSCTCSRSGPVNSQLSDVDRLAVDISRDAIQPVAVSGDVLRAVARKREIGTNTTVTIRGQPTYPFRTRDVHRKGEGLIRFEVIA